MSPRWTSHRAKSRAWSRCKTSCGVLRVFASCTSLSGMSSATNWSSRSFAPTRLFSQGLSVVVRATEGECRPMERERKARARPERGLLPLLTQLGLVTVSKSGGMKIAWREIGLTALLVATLTVLLLPRLQLQRRTLAIGDIAPADIKAHTDFLLEDEVSAQKKRKEAEEHILPVYDFDQHAIEAIDQRLQRAMQTIEAAYQVRPPELAGTLQDARSTSLTPEEA